MAGEVETMNVSRAGIERESLTALHVGNLDVTVTDDVLRRYFEQSGNVHSVKICYNHMKRPCRYGYVNFHCREDAEEAKRALNFTTLHGKPINISYSFYDPKYPRIRNANLFVKNLSKSVTDKDLCHIFTHYGHIMSSKIQKDDSGESMGYGFVQFKDETSASRAIRDLNGKSLDEDDLKLFVGLFMSHTDRQKLMEQASFTNVFVKNLSESTTREDLTRIFGEFGAVKNAVVMTDGDGKSKCFGFVSFEDGEQAARAVEGLNGKDFNGKKWYVGRAQKRKKREQELRIRNDRMANHRSTVLNNLYVKNLGDEVDDEMLKDWFSPFGTITSCKVMCDEKGLSKGFGFVAFSTNQEASRAMAEMKDQLRGGKPLYVAVAEKKEDRLSQHQATIEHNLPHAIMPIIAPHLPMHPTHIPGSVPGFRGQDPPVIFPHMPSVTYSSSQLVSVMRPIFPEMLMQMVPGATQVSRPRSHQQMLEQRNIFHPPRVYAGEGSSGVQETSGSVSLEALASALANASLINRRQMLRDKLFPLVKEIMSEMAGKVTDKLLEMDQAEVILLLESPAECLREKVDEAITVIIVRNH